MNPTQSVWQSRRFWTVIVDVVTAMVLYFTAKYAAPAMTDDVRFIIVTLQPVFLLMVAAFTYDDLQNSKRAMQQDLLAAAERVNSEASGPVTAKMTSALSDAPTQEGIATLQQTLASLAKQLGPARG